jgi:hypothetical protein
VTIDKLLNGWAGLVQIPVVMSQQLSLLHAIIFFFLLCSAIEGCGALLLVASVSFCRGVV